VTRQAKPQKPSSVDPRTEPRGSQDARHVSHPSNRGLPRSHAVRFVPFRVELRKAGALRGRAASRIPKDRARHRHQVRLILPT
jgi:hypothetical protein